MVGGWMKNWEGENGWGLDEKLGGWEGGAGWGRDGGFGGKGYGEGVGIGIGLIFLGRYQSLVK